MADSTKRTGKPVQPELPDISTPEARERRRRWLREQLTLLPGEKIDHLAGHQSVLAQIDDELIREYRAELNRLSRMDAAYGG